MPQTTEPTTTKPAPTELVHEVARLRQSIAHQVIYSGSDLPALPTLNEFREQYSALDAEVERIRQRAVALANAKSYLTTFEKDRKKQSNQLETVRSEVDRLAGALGTAAFQAFQAGQVSEHPSFEKRQAAAHQIKSLQKHLDELPVPDNADDAEKSRIASRKASLTRQLNAEQGKVSHLEFEIGKTLLDGAQEEAIRCDGTADILAKVAAARSQVADAEKSLGDSDSSHSNQLNEYCEILGIKSCDAETLDGEYENCRTALLDVELKKFALRQELPHKLIADKSLPSDEPLAVACNQFRAASEKLVEYDQQPLDQREKKSVVKDLKAHLELSYAEAGQYAVDHRLLKEELEGWPRIAAAVLVGVPFSTQLEKLSSSSSESERINVLEKIGRKFQKQHGNDPTDLQLHPTLAGTLADVKAVLVTIAELDNTSTLLGMGGTTQASLISTTITVIGNVLSYGSDSLRDAWNDLTISWTHQRSVHVLACAWTLWVRMAMCGVTFIFSVLLLCALLALPFSGSRESRKLANDYKKSDSAVAQQNSPSTLPNPSTTNSPAVATIPNNGNTPDPASTAAYFPHTPGVSRQFISVAYLGEVNMAFQKREVHKPNGVIETKIVQQGIIGATRLLDGGTVQWGKAWMKDDRFPKHYRINNGFVEIGDHFSETEEDITWEPVLKKDAKIGDKWEWTPFPNETQTYEVTKMGEWNGIPSLTVRKEWKLNGNPVIHFTTYARGVGKVISFAHEVTRNSQTGNTEEKLLNEVKYEYGPPQPTSTDNLDATTSDPKEIAFGGSIIYFGGETSRQEAQKLGDWLKSQGVFTKDAKWRLSLERSGSHYTMRIGVSEQLRDDKDFAEKSVIFCAVAFAKTFPNATGQLTIRTCSRDMSESYNFSNHDLPFK